MRVALCFVCLCEFFDGPLQLRETDAELSKGSRIVRRIHRRYVHVEPPA